MAKLLLPKTKKDVENIKINDLILFTSINPSMSTIILIVNVNYYDNIITDFNINIILSDYYFTISKERKVQNISIRDFLRTNITWEYL